MLWHHTYFLPPILLALLVSASPPESDFTIYHRLVVSSKPVPPFSIRGTIQISGPSPSLLPDPSAEKDVENWLEAAQGQGYYQIALQRSSSESTNEGVWNKQSVLACHLQSSTSDLITFQLSPTNDVYAFDYFVTPTPHDGSCPKALTSKSPKSGLISNTTVALRALNFRPVTPLRTPPPLTESGEAIKPPVEKTFFEKYWMFLMGGLVMFALLAPEPAGEEKGRDAQK